MSPWKIATLAEVASIERSGVQPEQIKDGTIYVGLEHIETGGRFIGLKPVDNGELASSKFQFTEQHILYGKLRPYLAKIACPEFSGICSTDILPILPRSNVDRKFLFHFLRQPKMVDYANSRAVGVNLPRLNPSVLANFEIPIPPLEEQRRIAEILARAEELRSKRREAIAQLDTLTQAIFLEMFGDPVMNPKGWSCKNLGDICAEIYRYPTFYGFEYQAIGTPVARIGNILLDGRLDPDISNYVFIDPAISKQFPRTILELHDIVMAVRGDGSTAKRIGLVTSDSLVGTNISPNLLRFKSKTKVSHPLFLFHFMVSDRGQSVLESYVTRTAKKTITAEGIKKIKVPLPPFCLQEEFARRVEAVEKLKAAHRASLSELDALFASLQHRAFRGEL